MPNVSVQGSMINPKWHGHGIKTVEVFPVFHNLYISAMPVDWIMVFHCTCFLLLISAAHFRRFYSELLHLSACFHCGTNRHLLCWVEQYQSCCCASEAVFISPLAGVAGREGMQQKKKILPPPCCQCCLHIPFQMYFYTNIVSVMWLVCTIKADVSQTVTLGRHIRFLVFERSVRWPCGGIRTEQK